MVVTLSPSQLAELLAKPNVHLIDVRAYNEFAGGHIEGAHSIPLEQLRSDPERELSHDSEIVFVCARGVRSLTAAKLAERFGYAHIYNVDGGTAAWARAGLPLVSERAAA